MLSLLLMIITLNKYINILISNAATKDINSSYLPYSFIKKYLAVALTGIVAIPTIKIAITIIS